MPTAYSKLQYSKQRIYKELQSKLETFHLACEFQGVSFETVGEIYKAVLEDHPEYFWLSGASSGTTKTCGAFSSVTFRPELRGSAASFDQIRKERTKLETKASELVSLAKRQSYDAYKQILFLHGLSCATHRLSQRLSTQLRRLRMLDTWESCLRGICRSISSLDEQIGHRMWASTW